MIRSTVRKIIVFILSSILISSLGCSLKPTLSQEKLNSIFKEIKPELERLTELMSRRRTLFVLKRLKSDAGIDYLLTMMDQRGEGQSANFTIESDDSSIWFSIENIISEADAMKGVPFDYKFAEDEIHLLAELAHFMDLHNFLMVAVSPLIMNEQTYEVKFVMAEYNNGFVHFTDGRSLKARYHTYHKLESNWYSYKYERNNIM